MTKAFVDTTVFTDALLKTGEVKKKAIEALNKFTVTELPVYAIKEFKAGPLNNFVWMHNKCVTTDSYEKALLSLHAMSRTPKRYTTSTAIEALKEAAGSIGKQTPTSLAEKYGKFATMDKIYCDELRLTIKTIVFKAWKRRRKITSDIVCPLYCYKETPPYEKRGLIELDPKGCDTTNECALGVVLRSKLDDLELMKEAIKNSEKKENVDRYRIMKEICRKPKMEIGEKECRCLGDVIFALLAPRDSTILSTNLVDYKPLAGALRKEVKRPDDIIT